MTPSGERRLSLRPGQLDVSRIAWAFMISLAIHLIGFGGYEAGQKLGIWRLIETPAWLRKPQLRASSVVSTNAPPQLQQREAPLMFVDVNPQVATPEPPKDAPFYSDKNSKAANPEPDKETGVPKITGEQTQVVKAEDVPRVDPNKLHPEAPPKPPALQEERAKPATPNPPGDLVMAKPETALRQDTGTAEQSRPRTIKEALMRQNRNQLVGQKMKQEGGVSRFQLFPSFDAKATPFGAYDAAFIEAVQSRWYDLLDNFSYDGYRRGRVVVQFHLTFDGRITDMKVQENTVGEVLGLLCQKAVLDPAPYDKWPREMRLMIDQDYREITFNFFYN